MSILLTIAFLLVFQIDYQDYNEGARYLSYFLTPATVCLAIPLYKQLELLKHHFAAVAGGIVSGVLASAFSIFALSKLFGLGHEHYVTLLPKSITTAIGIGVSEEAGGIVTLTVVSIVITGILGNVIADVIFKLFKIEEPVARGLALGTSAHAIGTARALEMGEIEGAMSLSLIHILTINREDTGEEIYKSGYLDPEQYIEEAPLNVELPAGEYPCVANFDAYRISDNAYIGRASARITLYVQN